MRSSPRPGSRFSTGGFKLTTVHLAVPIGTPAYAALIDQLRKEIVSGQIPHGTRLTIAELVERYGVSQMPVREALQALQGEGLLTILPHKGARVLSLDTKFVRNVYDIRNAIECLLACSARPNLTGSAIDELAEVQRRFAAVAKGGDYEQVFAGNREFHYLLYSHADNAEALRIYDHYNSLLGALRHTYGYSLERRSRMVQEHEETLAALRSRDVERLTRSIRVQCDQGMDDLLAKMSQ